MPKMPMKPMKGMPVKGMKEMPMKGMPSKGQMMPAPNRAGKKK